MGVCALSMMLFTGCGQLNLRWGTIPLASGEAEGVEASSPEDSSQEGNTLSQQEKDILQYEQKYYSGEFAMEDYHALAELYAEQGSIRRQRDMLEQSYRLYDDSGAFGLLQDIAVNLDEEDEEVRQQAMLLYQNLETPEYQNEAIHVIESEKWFDALMPTLGEGVRKYFLQEDGSPQLLICVGYDESGRSFTNVWYPEDEDKLTLLHCSGSVVQMLETALKEGKYDGDFSLWVLDGATGSILNEQGVFSEGVYSGEYTLKICRRNVAEDPFDLWNSRKDMEYASYTVKADGQGQGDLEQFAAKLQPYPAFPVYDVDAAGNANQIDGEGKLSQSGDGELQIRIFDGEIQIFQNGIWKNLGNVEQYMAKDPFRAYGQQKAEKEKVQLEEPKEGIDFDNLKLPAPPKTSEKDNSSSKPSTQKPATQKPATQKPATQTPTTQTPAPPAAPVPDAPSYDDGGNDDGGSSDNSGSDNSGSGSSGSDNGSSGSDDGGGDSGNETDVEWTPDLM